MIVLEDVSGVALRIFWIKSERADRAATPIMIPDANESLLKSTPDLPSVIMRKSRNPTLIANEKRNVSIVEKEPFFLKKAHKKKNPGTKKRMPETIRNESVDTKKLMFSLSYILAIFSSVEI
jgi:hypothetical protein